MAFFEKPIEETTTLDRVMAEPSGSANEDELIRCLLAKKEKN